MADGVVERREEDKADLRDLLILELERQPHVDRARDHLSVNGTSVAISEYCRLRKLRALSFEPKSPTGRPRRFELSKSLDLIGAHAAQIDLERVAHGRTRSSMPGMWKCVLADDSCSTIMS